jgi:hypothetical protein
MQASTSTAANAERQLAAFIRKFSAVDQRFGLFVREVAESYGCDRTTG